jgi:hypothetical protein
MSQTTLAELLGVSGKSIRWERPFLFLAALILADRLWPLANPSVLFFSHGDHFSRLFYCPPADSWFRAVLDAMLLVGLAVAALRFLPNVVVAVAVVAITYGPLTVFIRFLGSAAVMPWPSFGEFGYWGKEPALWACLFLGLLAIALRWVKPVWLALLLGAMASGAAHRLYLWWNLPATPAEMGIDNIRWWLLEEVVSMIPFAGLLWVGLRLTSDQPVAAGQAQPRLRNGYYLGTLLATGPLYVFLSGAVTAVTTRRNFSSDELIPVLFLLIVVCLLCGYATIVGCVLMHKAWAAIQDGRARTSPGRAVGFLFIPVFNLYWVFQAFWGFAKDFNAFAARHSLNVPRLPSGMFLAIALLYVGGLIPVLNLLSLPAAFILGLVLVPKVCAAVNAVAETLPAGGSKPSSVTS